jgi:thioesterase domain-containing protein
MYAHAPQPVELPTYPFDAERFELPFANRERAATSDQVEQLQRDIAAIDESARSGSGSTRAGERGANAAASGDAWQFLVTLREIVTSVASDTAAFPDDVALVSQGMDSLALTELRVRLHQSFDKMPPMSMLARGASLITLADWLSASRDTAATLGVASAADDRLDQADGVDERALVVPLRDGSGPLIALVHPVGGDVLCYQALAAAWPGDPSIVAVRHPYSDQDREVRYLSITRLASLYRRAIVAATGRTPDRLGGWSFGGLVAQEMAVQWESEGSEAPPLLLIDSPLSEGPFAKRLGQIVGEHDVEEGSRLVAQMLADKRFDAMLDDDFFLAETRRRAHADTFAHIARLHASCAAALILHRPRQARAQIQYALAARGQAGVGASREQTADRLRVLSGAAITVTVFDEDHNSIVRDPCATNLARFLNDVAHAREPASRLAPTMLGELT